MSLEGLPSAFSGFHPCCIFVSCSPSAPKERQRCYCPSVVTGASTHSQKTRHAGPRAGLHHEASLPVSKHALGSGLQSRQEEELEEEAVLCPPQDKCLCEPGENLLLCWPVEPQDCPKPALLFGNSRGYVCFRKSQRRSQRGCVHM